ncbi:hypothetical protein A3A14_00815 [Candidatus Daviesbacteria bacterium RIFCSPLOWO2_01_FULL_43_38]|uniref:dolichyl-phosphate beta-glucosyltransferase n=2 Tax=Candidatus Daviesiibacteriota TaxID=1752718 RepID=A0A1F5K710_9BACT|nr:MAG: Glycosyl transferase, family 2 [Candidatus Daviesbacteria bacterium GW2011_GWA2_42_7]OGE36461.1 MAG: hypothetical protein A3E45_00895 [Candidatus Daviesbacteria bacterium RIFCSPHIGHO2_12_FULL_43_11]OGE63506.1 MAG: hypothetical protein A3A14_00815 [Candidatus Daviesbacteria bacterium RIFCSPLOWO2_01_FULL_43_38]
MNEVKLSVIIPAFNESKNIEGGALGEVYNYLKDQSYTWEVVVVDDGSSDDTAKKVREQIKDKEGFRLLENSHGGKAITVMTGMLSARGEVAVFTDMDQATPIAEIEKFFPKFDEGFDIVIGSRKGRKGAPVVRKLMGWGFSMLRGLILGLPFADTQCGFKAFNRKAIRAVFPALLTNWQKVKVSGAAVNAGFDVETLYLARKKDLKIAEVLVNWRHVGTERVQAINDSLEALKDMTRIKFSDLKGRYG